ncbi:MAG: DNA polymerase III subunit beta [Pseudomonadota bacterium]|nr:DNA polymerase III subunit beta [Pseudomonadota bacterium]
MLVLKSSKDALLKPLQAVAGVVERKHTLPILSNVLLEVVGGRVAFIATDLELQISTWAEAQGASDAAFTVSARKLLDISRSLQDVDAISLDLNNDQLKVQSGRSRFNLQTLPARDFPKLQIPEGQGLTFSLPQGLIKQLLSRVQYAMAVQDIRYYLNGMLFSIHGKRLTVAATDGHRLAVDGTDMEEEVEQGIDVILPRKTVLELGKLLNDGDEQIQIQVNQNQIVFRRQDFELRSKVVDGKFPDWQRVVPVGHDKCFAIQSKRLSQSLNRAAILTNDKYRGVRIALTPGSLRIACSNNEQEEAQEELDIDYSGDSLDIGFNIQYLQDVLNNVVVESVLCSFGDPTSSLLITVPGEENFRYVVMPMRI